MYGAGLQFRRKTRRQKRKPMSSIKTNLDLIQIASPCSASWDEMVGDDRVRFCEQCKLSVYNVSDMGREEAEAFILERSTAGQVSSGTRARACLRLFRRAD